jgi:hypothetical protein
MSKFDLSDAVNLFAQEAGAIGSLWAVFAAATFAAVGFALSGHPPSTIARTAVTLGFLAFAAGHWSLLQQALRVSRALKSDIRNAIVEDPKNPFKLSLNELTTTANTDWVSLVIHIVIDLCVVAALWY